MCFDVDEKPLGLYILRLNNFGLIYELWTDIATAGSKNGNFRLPHSHLMPPIQRTPTIIGITLILTKYSLCATFPPLVVRVYGSIFVQILGRRKM